jgi:hypothetical protein
MSDRSPISRIIGAAYLVLAFALSSVLPIAEARAEAASVAVVAHVEAPNDRGCPPIHDHWSCNICRALRLFARSEPAATVDLADAGHVASPPDCDAARGVLTPRSPSRSRAPPTPAAR